MNEENVEIKETNNAEIGVNVHRSKEIFSNEKVENNIEHSTNQYSSHIKDENEKINNVSEEKTDIISQQISLEGKPYDEIEITNEPKTDKVIESSYDNKMISTPSDDLVT